MKNLKRSITFSFCILLSLLLISSSYGETKKSNKKISKISKVNNKKEYKLIRYKIKKGDTPAKIANRYNISVEKLISANKNLNPKNLKIGSVILIPVSKEIKSAKSKVSEDKKGSVYIVKKGDTLFSISKKYSISVEELKKLNNLKDNNLTVGMPLTLKTDYLVYKPKPKKEVQYSLTENREDETDYGEYDEDENTNVLTENNDELNRSDETDKLKYTLTDEDVRKLITVALDYIGASYKYGGNEPASIDCSAFVKRVFSEVNIKLPRTSREQFEFGVFVPLEQLSEGDLLFFKRKKRIGHVGIYIGDNMFIHAAGKGKGVIISSIDSPYFKKSFVGAKRLFIKNSEKTSLDKKNLSLAEKPLVN